MLDLIGFPRPEFASKWEKNLTDSIGAAEKSVEVMEKQLTSMESKGKHRGRQSLYERLDVEKAVVNSLKFRRTILHLLWK